MIENQKETPQEKPKSTPTVIVIVIVAHRTSFSIRPKTTGSKWWNGARRAKGSSSVIHIGGLTTSAADFSKETPVVKEEETYDAGVFERVKAEVVKLLKEPPSLVESPPGSSV